MRISPAFAAPLLLLASPASAGMMAQPDRTNCPKPATSSDGRLFKRLADLPPANAYQAVLRSDQRGCAKAVPIKRNIGRPR